MTGTDSYDSYDGDFYAWTQQQAALLREGSFGELDVEHLAEEVESMGRSERRELVSRLAVLLTHLLKWQHQPSLRSRSWELTILEQRAQIEEMLEENPSFRPQFEQFVARAYRFAQIEAARDTGLAVEGFPAACPYDTYEILDAAWLPH